MVINPKTRSEGPTPRFEEAPFDPIEALCWGGRVLKEEPERVGLPLVFACFVVVFASVVVPTILSGIANLIAETIQVPFLGTILVVIARLVGATLSLVVAAYASTGVYPFVLNVARGRPVEFWDLFRHTDRFPRCCALLFCISIGVIFGIALCVLPGIAVIVITFMTMPLIVDGDLTVIESLKKSYELARSNFILMSFFCLLCFGAILLGLVLCLAGAVLVAGPIVLLAQAYVFLRLRGETPVST
jgi:uncharacterized membrane protein